MSLESLLSEDSITVQSQTKAKDSSGGATVTPYQDLYTGVPARIEDASADQRSQYAMLQMHITHTIFTQQAGIKNGHGIKDASGRFFRVKGVQQYRGIGGMDTYYQVMAEEVQTS